MHTNFVYNTLWQGRISLLLRALNKDFYFISEKLFYKAIENFFPVFA